MDETEKNAENQEHSNGYQEAAREIIPEYSAPKLPFFWKKLKQPSITEWILVAITIILAAANIIVIIYAADQAKSANEAATAAKASVDAAKQNLLLYEKATHIDLRPYISLTLQPPRLRVGDSVKVEIEYKNVGKTPAYDLGHAECLRMGTGVYSDDIEQVQSALVRTSQAVSPGQSYFDDVDWRKFTAGDSVALSEGKFRLNLWGKFTYKDRFGEDHFVHFCGWYTPTVGGFSLYHHYNDAD